MNRFLKHWRLSKCDEAFRAHVVAYADDFVILSRGCANEALAWTKVVMTQLGLTLNEEKTSLKNARQEHFDFLGYSFGPHSYKANGKRYLGASPSKKSVQRLKTKVRSLLVPGNHDPWRNVCDELNRILRGWSNYFCYGTRQSAFRAVDHFVYEHVRDFLARRHKVAGRGSRRFSTDIVYERTGTAASRTPALNCPAVCLTKKPVGKPDAVAPHVRFDERGEETELWRRMRHRQLAKAVGNSYSPSPKRHRVSPRLYHYGLRGPIRPHPSHVRSWKMPTSTSVGRAKLQQTLPLPPLAGQAVAKINHQNPP